MARRPTASNDVNVNVRAARASDCDESPCVLALADRDDVVDAAPGERVRAAMRRAAAAFSSLCAMSRKHGGCAGKELHASGNRDVREARARRFAASAAARRQALEHGDRGCRVRDAGKGRAPAGRRRSARRRCARRTLGRSGGRASRLDVDDVVDAHDRCAGCARASDHVRAPWAARRPTTNGTPALGDAGLLARDRFERLAEHVGVIVADRRDRRNDGLQDVRAVEPAAEPDLDHGDVDALAREVQRTRAPATFRNTSDVRDAPATRSIAGIIASSSAREALGRNRRYRRRARARSSSAGAASCAVRSACRAACSAAAIIVARRAFSARAADVNRRIVPVRVAELAQERAHAVELVRRAARNGLVDRSEQIRLGGVEARDRRSSVDDPIG